MMRQNICILLFLVSALVTKGQQFSMSLGVYSGITSSFTYDKGINEDPRYDAKYQFKIAPIGLHLGVDYEGFGVLFSPGIINLGQNFYVVNTMGGQDGLRKNEQQYLNIPVALKIHLVSLTFFKLSVLASFGPAFLLAGKDEISHNDSKLNFPIGVYPILPPNYTVEYDGVLVPVVNQFSIAQKKDFKSLQLFAGAGFRSDWDPSNHWRISLDVRFNYGISDPRKEGYTDLQKSNLSLYEIPGQRREMFAQVTLGISRYIEFEKSEREQKKQLKGTSRKYQPVKYPGKKVRQSKPKG